MRIIRQLEIRDSDAPHKPRHFGRKNGKNRCIMPGLSMTSDERVDVGTWSRRTWSFMYKKTRRT